MICLKIIDKDNNTVAVCRGEQEVNLVVYRAYEEGDRILLESSEKVGYVWLQLDDALGKSLIYYTGMVEYKIPFGEKRINLSPKAFYGKKHLIKAKEARDFEVNMYQNLALNVNDHHDNKTYFPHVSANVETRGESIFAAQNAIDGVTANTCHGEWPYESWGINRNKDAYIKLDFGREVEVDRIVIYLRADFPHDNWWKSAKIMFSNGDTQALEFVKTGEAQEFLIEPKKIKWLKLLEMIQSEEASPFPALTQIEVYGRNL